MFLFLVDLFFHLYLMLLISVSPKPAQVIKTVDGVLVVLLKEEVFAFRQFPSLPVLRIFQSDLQFFGYIHAALAVD